MTIRTFLEKNRMILLLALCFCISPVLSLPFALLVYAKERSGSKQVVAALFFSLAMAYLAFHTVPLESDDLSRHYSNMALLRNLPVRQILHSSYSGVYLNTVIMYLIGKTGLYGLYPALYVGIGYFLVLYNAKRLGVHKRSVAEVALIILFVFFCINCRDFISGLRNYFAFILCGYLIVSYKCFSLNRWVCYGLLAVLILIHTSVLIVLAVFLCSEISWSKLMKRLILLAELLFLPVCNLAANVLMMVPVFNTVPLVTKVHAYFQMDSIINRNVFLFQLGIVVLAVICHLLNKYFYNEEYKKLENFLDYFLVFMVAVAPRMLFLSRMLFLLVPLMPFVLMHTYRILREQKVLEKITVGNKTVLIRNCFSCVLILFVVAGILMFLASLRAYPWYFDVSNVFVTGLLR